MRVMNMEQLIERELAGEKGVHRENLTQCHFVHHKSNTFSVQTAAFYKLRYGMEPLQLRKP
jgi:hypothetical protein